MSEILTGLGAEVLSIKPELASASEPLLQSVLFFFACLYIGYLMYRINICSRILSICSLIFVIGALISLLYAGYQVFTESKETGNVISEIQVNDETNIREIFERFEVIDVSNYPAITVKGKQ